MLEKEERNEKEGNNCSRRNYYVCDGIVKKVPKKRGLGYLAGLILAVSILTYNTSFSCSASPPSFCSLSADPPTYIGESQGENFDVEIEISDVENLSKFEFTIAFNPSILHVQDICRGYSIPPDAILDFEVDEQLGLIAINTSILEFHEPISGEGSLTKLSFEVIGSLPSGGSPICFQQIRLLDQNSEEIDYRHVSAVFFWRSVEPWNPDEERYVDVYTQKGGEGLGESDGDFCYGEIVVLEAYVTYFGWPQQDLLVAFQVLDPQNETLLIFVTETNQSGFADTSFRIPEHRDSIGRWTVIASVDVACQIIWDTLTFQVDSCVGGRTVQVNVNMHQRLAVYLIALGIAIATLRRRRLPFHIRERD